MMSDMPDVIWANQYPTNSYHLNSGTYHSRGAIRTEYIRADIADQLGRAVELILNSDMAMREEDEGEISTELSHARAALEAYRKAKGE